MHFSKNYAITFDAAGWLVSARVTLSAYPVTKCHKRHSRIIMRENGDTSRLSKRHAKRHAKRSAGTVTSSPALGDACDAW